jgi:hypothetical protein
VENSDLPIYVMQPISAFIPKHIILIDLTIHQSRKLEADQTSSSNQSVIQQQQLSISASHTARYAVNQYLAYKNIHYERSSGLAGADSQGVCRWLVVIQLPPSIPRSLMVFFEAV